MFKYTAWMSLCSSLAPVVTLVFLCWLRRTGHAASDLGVELQSRLHPSLPIPPILLQPHVPDAVPGSARAMPRHTDRIIDSTSAPDSVLVVLLFLKIKTCTYGFVLSLCMELVPLLVHSLTTFPIDFFQSSYPVFHFSK